MKTTILSFIFLFLTIGVNAQETEATDIAILTVEETTNAVTTDVNNNSLEKDMCYGEISKTAFYEALIRQNGFDIQLKDSNDTLITLRNTEDIINSNKERISYSD